MFQSPLKNHKAYSIGLDPSLTSFGVYCLPLGHNDWYGYSMSTAVKDGNDTDRVLALANGVIETLHDLPYPPAIIVFEDYGPIGRTSGKIAQRAEMCGIIKHHALTVLNIPIAMVSPTALKQFATTKGNAKKEEMLTEANNYGYFPDTHDEADAYFAARLGVRLHSNDKTGVAFHRVNPVA